MPGGKWMPEMKRTVRDESGAWSLLKNAPVRARPIARSSLAPVAPAWRYRRSTLPARSTTAIVIGGEGGAATTPAAVCARLVTSAGLKAGAPASGQFGGADSGTGGGLWR